MRILKKIAFLLILNPMLLGIFLVGSAEKYTDGVWTVRLRDCDLDYHSSIHAVALACPGMDYMRLWPLPVTQPWPDPTDWPEGPGWYARRIGPQAEAG